MAERVKITDIARLAGVSASTVSHAISGKRPISSEVKDRIFKTIEEAGYRPNIFAKSMRGERTRFIGVLCDQCHNPKTAEIIELLGTRLAAHGCDIVLGLSGLDVPHGEALLRKFSSGMVDGIINMMPLVSDASARKLAGMVPVVTYMRSTERPVDIDNAGIVRRSLELLWEAGHRRIGFIASASASPLLATDPKIAAYHAFMESRHVPEVERYVGTAHGVIDAVSAAADFGTRVTAIVCGDDGIASGVYQWAYSAGRRIPDDLSVIGCDDSQLAICIHPRLTTFRFPAEELVENTVAELLGRLDGKDVSAPPRLLTPELIIRNSVATAQ